MILFSLSCSKHLLSHLLLLFFISISLSTHYTFSSLLSQDYTHTCRCILPHLLYTPAYTHTCVTCSPFYPAHTFVCCTFALPFLHTLHFVLPCTIPDLPYSWSGEYTTPPNTFAIYLVTVTHTHHTHHTWRDATVMRR